jgi:PAS domain S-box-containing protein
MIENLNSEQIARILETVPVDISFVDKDDKVKFWNKHETRVFKRPNSALGRTVQDCHPARSVDKVNQVLADLKSGKRDYADFWIDLKGRKVYIRYFAVRDNSGKYLGTLEIGQDITDIKTIEGKKEYSIIEEGEHGTERNPTTGAMGRSYRLGQASFRCSNTTAGWDEL